MKLEASHRLKISISSALNMRCKHSYSLCTNRINDGLSVCHTIPISAKSRVKKSFQIRNNSSYYDD